MCLMLKRDQEPKKKNAVTKWEKKTGKQVGAELCQAQVKLGLAKLADTRMKLKYEFEVVFLLGKILRSSSILQMLRSSSI